MANKGLSMRKVREVLRLHHVAGLSGRAIARSLKLSPVTVKRYVRRAEAAGLSWPLPESLDDAQLERRVLPGRCRARPGSRRPTGARFTASFAARGLPSRCCGRSTRQPIPRGCNISMDGSPGASDIELSAWVSCKHLSGITRVGVPK